MADDPHAFATELRGLLGALIAAAIVQDEGAAKAARSQALAAHARLVALGPAPEIGRGRLDGLWYQAMEAVETTGFLGSGLGVSPNLPKRCPLELDELLKPGLALPEIEERIRSSASTG